MISNEYWVACVESALDDAEIDATAEQVEIMAGVIDGAHEVFGEATGECVADTNLHAMHDREHQALQDELKAERDKVTCKECRGLGERWHRVGTAHWSTSQCWKCNGDGRHAP